MTRAKNILLISLDDAVAFRKVQSLFGADLQTPNLDRICAQSTLFDNAYCQAPVCSPSRASMMTGKAPHQTGVTGPERDIFARLPVRLFWPRQLKLAGYYTSSGGKVIKSYTPLPRRAHARLFCDDPKIFQIERRRTVFARKGQPDPMPKRAYGGFRAGHATTDPADDVTYYDHQVASSAIDFLQGYDGDAPFYREVGFHDPHGPWTTPQRFKELYDHRLFTPPPDWARGFDPCPAMDRVSPPNISDTSLDYWQKSLRNYFSAYSHADHHLGRVWDALKASRHADTTLVVIVSDHGLHLGERNRIGKHTLWEQVANVPLILHDPADPRAQVVTDPVALLDVGPTIMDYAGLPPIRRSPGRPLRPLLQGARAPDRAILTVHFHNAAIRKGRYRFIRYHDGSTQLFDLSRDWWQTDDLGPGHPKHAILLDTLIETCRTHGLELPLHSTP